MLPWGCQRYEEACYGVMVHALPRITCQAMCRWCLTGTPIVNSATDVFSLFVFLEYR